jgi:hypothetical protein
VHLVGYVVYVFYELNSHTLTLTVSHMGETMDDVKSKRGWEVGGGIGKWEVGSVWDVFMLFIIYSQQFNFISPGRSGLPKQGP